MILHWSPLLTEPLGTPEINTIDCIIVFFFLSYSKIVHSWFSGTRHVTVLLLKLKKEKQK